MLVGNLNTILGTVNRLKSDTSTIKIQTDSRPQATDRVDISDIAKAKIPLGMAQQAMLDFNSALIETLSVSGSDPLADLYNLVGTPVDGFIKGRFSDLNSETKQEFMALFTGLSQTAGGLVPEQLLSETFGATGGFPQMIDQISRSLNRYFR